MTLRKPAEKLHENRGETLIETLAAILVAALATALLFSGVTTSVKMAKSAQVADDAYYKTVSGAENRKTAVSVPTQPYVTVKVSGNDVVFVPIPTTVNVNLYGGNGLYSYKEVP